MAFVTCLVHLRDADGRPVREAVVTIAQASAPVPELAYVPDADGAIQIGLPEGPVVLEVIVPSSGRENVVLTVGPGGSMRFTVTFHEPGRPHVETGPSGGDG